MTTLEQILKQAEKAAEKAVKVAKPIAKAAVHAAAEATKKPLGEKAKEFIAKPVVKETAKVIVYSGAGITAVWAGKKIHDKIKKEDPQDAEAEKVLNEVEGKVAEKTEKKEENKKAEEKKEEETPKTEDAKEKTPEAPKAEEKPTEQTPVTADPEQAMYFVPGLGYVQVVTPTPEMMAQIQQQNAQPNPAFQMKQEMAAADQAPVEESGSEKVDNPEAPVNPDDIVITAKDIATGKAAVKSKAAAANKAEKSSVKK